MKVQNKIEMLDTAKLIEDPRNARRHNRRNLETIKASLVRFGQQKPIVVDGDGIVRAGNGTLAAARELGWGKNCHHPHLANRRRGDSFRNC